MKNKQGLIGKVAVLEDITEDHDAASRGEN